MEYAALIQGIIGLAGELNAQGQRAQAQALLNQARANFEGIQLPTLEEIEAQQLGASAFEGVKPDAEADAAQREALRMALTRAKTGYTPEDEAALMELSSGVGQTARHQREGIAQQMAQRGALGSGIDYALQADAASNAAMRAALEGARARAEASRRQMEGGETAARMASSLRGQTGQEAARLAEARDAIARQNAAYRAAAQEYNTSLGQRRFENRMKRAQGILGASGGAAENLNWGSGQTLDMAGRMGQRAYDAGLAIKDAYGARSDPTYRGQASSASGRMGSSEDEWNRWRKEWPSY